MSRSCAPVSSTTVVLEPSLKAHADYFTRLARQTEPKLHEPDQQYWLDYLDGERDNFRAALEWAAHSGDARAGPELAVALSVFWHHRGYTREALAWYKQLILDRPAVNQRWRIQALYWSSQHGEILGDAHWEGWLTEARALSQQLGDERLILDTTLMAADRLRSSLEQELAELEQAVHLARRMGDTWSVAYGLSGMGLRLSWQGETKRACEVLTEAVALWREMGNWNFLGGALVNLGVVAFKRGDDAHAVQSLEEGVALVRKVGVAPFIAYHVMESATVLMHLGDFGRSAQALREALSANQHSDDSDGLVRCLCVAARLAQVSGRPGLAARLFGAVEDRRPHLPPYSFTFQERYDAWIDELRAALGPEAFDTAWASGRTLTHEQAVDVALASLTEGAVERQASAARM